MRVVQVCARVATMAVLAGLGTVPTAGVLTAPAAAAAAGADSTTSTTAGISAKYADYRQQLTITGTVLVEGPDGDSGWLPDAEVVLQRRWRGAAHWHKLGTATTTGRDGDGRYAFDVVARRNATFRVRYAGESRDDGADTVTFGGSVARVTSWVRRDLRTRVDEPAPDRLVLAGRARPGGRQSVQLLRKTCRHCTWTPSREKRTSRTGRFRFRLGAPEHGSWYYRVQTPASRRFLETRSKTWRTFTTIS
jgi:hypothetical protein